MNLSKCWITCVGVILSVASPIISFGQTVPGFHQLQEVQFVHGNPQTLIKGAHDVRIADVNLDGYADLLATVSTPEFIVARRDPSLPGLAFPLIETYNHPSDIVFRRAIDVADVTGDGLPDVNLGVAFNGGSPSMQYNPNQGGGVFINCTPQSPCPPGTLPIFYLFGVEGFNLAPDWLRFTDFNADGHQDFFWQGWGGYGLWHSDGAGGFVRDIDAVAALGKPSVRGFTVTDMNNDNAPDLVVIGGIGLDSTDDDVAVLLNNGSGDFSIGGVVFDAIALEAHTVATGDFNGDGHRDVIVSSTSGSVTLYRGDASGDIVFEDIFDHTGTLIEVEDDINAADFNLDGIDDVLIKIDGGEVVNGMARFEILYGAPNFAFSSPEIFQIAGKNITRIDIGYVDEDAAPDIVLGLTVDSTNAYGSFGILLNSALAADITGDNCVNGSDLAQLLTTWGECGSGPCSTDLNGDGFVNGADLAILLTNWGVGCEVDPGDPELLMASGGGAEMGGVGLIQVESEAPQTVETNVPWVLAALGFQSVDDYLSFIDALSDMELFAHINALLEIIQNENE